jgi:hypothetical protein
LRAAEASFEAHRTNDETNGIHFVEITHREVLLVDKL